MTRHFPTARPRRATLLLAACVGVLAGPSPVAAGERLLLTGAELADSAHYAYVGTLLPLGERRDGRGWQQRYWLDTYGYEYDGGPGRVEAEAYGLEAALGYGGGDALGWWGVSAGLRYTDTTLAPDDRGAGARGSQLGAKVQVDFERRLGQDWRAGAIASWSDAQDAYWVRGRLVHGTTGAGAFGLEAIASGNDEAEATAFGLVKTFQPRGSRISVGLKAGWRFEADTDGAYGGLEFGYGW